MSHRILRLYVVVFFFFKQKTAYEMRISDWSSDVCSSDLLGGSLRTPAGYCGVVGMRPTPGVVPTVRKEMAWSPMWTEGPMARSVADLALFLEALAGGDRKSGV